MLPKYNNKFDFDGYTTLFVSAIAMVATLGITYAACLVKIFRTAKNTRFHFDENLMVCVLGKRLSNDRPDNDYIARLNRAYHLLRHNTESQVLLLGGKTGNASLTEAEAGKKFLLENNVDILRIHVEQASRNTLENLQNAMALLKEKNQKIIIVSNRYHLERVLKMANGFELNVEVCAAEEKLKLNHVTLIKLIIEALHVHWYLSGRYYAHLTKNQKMIKRIG